MCAQQSRMSQHFTDNNGDYRWNETKSSFTIKPHSKEASAHKHLVHQAGLVILSYLWELAVWHSRPRSRQRRFFLLCCSAWRLRLEPEGWRGSLMERQRNMSDWTLSHGNEQHGGNCGRKPQLPLKLWVKRATSHDCKSVKNICKTCLLMHLKHIWWYQAKKSLKPNI